MAGDVKEALSRMAGTVIIPIQILAFSST